MSTFACTSAATSSPRPSPAAPAAGLLRRPGRPADQGARAARLRADLRPARRRAGAGEASAASLIARACCSALARCSTLPASSQASCAKRAGGPMRIAALPPQRRAGADDQVLPPRGTATARRADQPRPGAVRRVTPAAAAADPRPGRGGRAVHRRHRRPARRQRIAGNQPARRARQGAVRHDPPVRAPRRRRVPAGRRPPGRRAHPRPRLAGQAGHPGPGTAHRRPGRPCATWARTDLLALADACAGPAGQIAAADLAAIDGRRSLDSQLEGVIFGAVLGDILPAALRRLAGEDASAPFRKRPPPRHRRPPACRG